MWTSKKSTLNLNHSLLNNLADILVDNGQFVEAESLFRRSISIKESKLVTAFACNNLAYLLASQKNHEEACLLFQRSLGVFKSELGIHHPKTKIAQKDFDDFLDLQNQIEQQ